MLLSPRDGRGDRTIYPRLEESPTDAHGRAGTRRCEFLTPQERGSMSSDCSSGFASNYIEEAGQKNNSP